MKKSVLVVFGKKAPQQLVTQYDEVIFGVELEKHLETESIYVASSFLAGLSKLELANGAQVSKALTYEGYELWWIHYHDLFQYFCLPYSRYKKLLEYLSSFKKVCFYNAPHENLFSCYLTAHGVEFKFVHKLEVRRDPFLPFGVFVQIILSFLFVLVLAILRPKVLLFTGDKLEKDKDYDFRMRFIYEELRIRGITFVEFIRSLESWKTIFKHAVIRRRPVVYPGGVVFLARFLGILFGEPAETRKKFGSSMINASDDSNKKFKLLVATQYLLTSYEDVWAIRIMKALLGAIGTESAIIAAANERNFHTVLACKIRGIPIVGILHGAASRYYNVYDFLPGFDGGKSLSVDKYGLWSEWWRNYYEKYSDAYKPEQLFVSGPMRPLGKREDAPVSYLENGPIRALFVSEELAVPEEAVVCLEALVKEKNIEVYLVFRPYRDGFENWLKNNRPDVLSKFEEGRITRTGIKNALPHCEVAIGTMSTAVMEALFENKVPIYFRTQKWGDYFELEHYCRGQFFASDLSDLMEKISSARSVSKQELLDLKERFFGDPYKNGSKWVVDQLEEN